MQLESAQRKERVSEKESVGELEWVIKCSSQHTFALSLFVRRRDLSWPQARPSLHAFAGLSTSIFLRTCLLHLINTRAVLKWQGMQSGQQINAILLTSWTRNPCERDVLNLKTV